ncbi:unnamed protein product [Heterobilharzia americana]|nr:unnamed protein product [Heterobilharzia americana]
MLNIQVLSHSMTKTYEQLVVIHSDETWIVENEIRCSREFSDISLQAVYFSLSQDLSVILKHGSQTQ